MRRFSQTIVVVAFLGFVSVPLLLTLLGQRPGATDNRAVAEPPDLSPRALVDERTYQELDRYLSDQFALRELAIRADARLDDLVWKGDRGDVRRGEDGWLYYGPSLTQLCQEPMGPQVAVEVLDRFAAGLDERGVEFRYLVAPEKPSLYPEYLTDRLRGDGECGRGQVALLRAELGAASRPWYVDLYEPLEQLKAQSDEPIYHPRDTHWTGAGAALFVERMVDSLDPGLWRDGALRVAGTADFEPDLTRLLGLPQRVEVPEFEIVRDGVTTTVSAEVPVEGAQPIRRSTSRTTGEGLVEGRSVVIYDSFGLSAIDLVQPFFADVSFVHWNAVDSPEAEALLDAADTVVAQGAEREVTWRVREKLDASGLASRWAGG